MASRQISIGIIGTGWMGSVHCRAYREVSERFPESGLAANLVACADNLPGRAAAEAQRLGIPRATEDWRELLDDPSIDAVSIATRNDSHVEIAIAAAESGKHIFCEKPVGRTPAETAAIAAAARSSGVVTFVGFCYRWVPLVAYAAQLARSGRLGRILHYRGTFFAAYGATPLAFRTWRYVFDESGYGVLGDLMTHVVDMATLLAGPIVEVSSQQQTVYPERPAPIPGADHYAIGSDADPRLPVSNEDSVITQARFESGATASLEASRILQTPANEFGFSIYGTEGVASWQFSLLNKLQLFIAGEEPERIGINTVFGGRFHPNHARFSADLGGGIDYEALQVIGAHRFLSAIAAGESQAPDFESTLKVSEVNAAMTRSWQSRRWEPVTAVG